ncbi:MAG: hypothetical protein GY754_14905 [bacterium]|nr:hypothetical protein [bacterium]
MYDRIRRGLIFKDKNDIFLAVVYRGQQIFLSKLNKAVEQPHGEPQGEKPQIYNLGKAPLSLFLSVVRQGDQLTH